MMPDYRKNLVEIASDVSKAQNVDFFSPDFQVSRAGNAVRISIAVDTALVIWLIPSSGSGFALNGGTALTVNAVHTETVALDSGRTWNMQTPTGTGGNVLHCVVQEIQG